MESVLAGLAGAPQTLLTLELAWHACVLYKNSYMRLAGSIYRLCCPATTNHLRGIWNTYNTIHLTAI